MLVVTTEIIDCTAWHSTLRPFPYKSFLFVEFTFPLRLGGEGMSLCRIVDDPERVRDLPWVTQRDYGTTRSP